MLLKLLLTPLCCFLELAAYREVAVKNCFTKTGSLISSAVSVILSTSVCVYKQASKSSPGPQYGPLASVKYIDGS